MPQRPRQLAIQGGSIICLYLGVLCWYTRCNAIPCMRTTVLILMSLSIASHLAHATGTNGGFTPNAEVSKENADAASSKVSNGSAEAGGALAPHSVANGNFDAASRGQVNAASAGALANSALVDEMYANGRINRKDWLKLKAQMTSSMMAPINAAKKQAPANPIKTPGIEFDSPREVNSAVGIPAPARREPSSIAAPLDTVNASPEEQIVELKYNSGFVAPTLVAAENSSGLPTERLAMDDSAIAPALSEEAKQNAGSTIVLQKGQARDADAPVSEEAQEKYEKAVLLAQKLLKEHKAKLSGKGEKSDGKTAESFQEAHAKALLSLQGLKKQVARVQDSDRPAEIAGLTFRPEQVVSAMDIPGRGLASEVVTNPFGKAEGSIFDSEEPLSTASLVLMGLLGLFAGLAAAYSLVHRTGRTVVSLMVPGAGEHFTVRPGAKPGEYILDIMDVRGILVRTAGTLRPDSVARAAVLPPELAAKLGAKGAFDRFEFNGQEFVRTDKEEGYQVFPFVL